MINELQKLLERNEIADVIYMSANGKLTKRRLKLISVSSHSFHAYCFLRRERRTFKIDQVLAIQKVIVRERTII